MDLIDDYEHEDSNLLYIVANIPTRSTKEKFEEEFSEGCDCKIACTIETKCSCLEKSDARYVFLEGKRTETSNYVIETKQTGKPIFECNSKCKCFEYSCCGNRLVQLGPRKHLTIIKCGEDEVESKGLGLKTTINIEKGNFVCEYAGEVISQAEAVERHQINKRDSLMNYIFCVNEYFGENCITTYIDPFKFGNIGRYLNHSCEPNCELIPIRVDTVVPKLCIFAKVDIEENSELTFDYGVNDKEHLGNVKCLCGSTKCKKFLPFNNKM